MPLRQNGKHKGVETAHLCPHAGVAAAACIWSEMEWHHRQSNAEPLGKCDARKGGSSFEDMTDQMREAPPPTEKPERHDAARLVQCQQQPPPNAQYTTGTTLNGHAAVSPSIATPASVRCSCSHHSAQSGTRCISYALELPVLCKPSAATLTNCLCTSTGNCADGHTQN